jgi:CRP-like cAMP-binding protein
MGTSIPVVQRPAVVTAVQPSELRGESILGLANVARKGVEYGRRVAVFNQGDPATSVLYIQRGIVKVTVVNEAGQEAVMAILGPGEFLGEAILAGQTRRVNTATTITTSTILAIEVAEMVRLLHTERALSDQFLRQILSKNMRAEEDLIDQLFNHSEKRLARALLLLAHYGQPNSPQHSIPNISQEVLAEMIGTTRPRVNLFLNKFRKRGFIEYSGRLRGLHIHKTLLSVILQN